MNLEKDLQRLKKEKALKESAMLNLEKEVKTLLLDLEQKKIYYLQP